MSRSNRLRFHFEAIEPVPDPKALFSGWGRLSLFLGEELVWGEETAEGGVEGFDEYWDGLLLHLARIQPYLLSDQSYPLGYFPESPARFIDEALSGLRWGDLPDAYVMKDEREIFDFSKRHNLADGMASVHLPYVYFIREGNDMRVVSETADILVPLSEAMETLEKLGNEIQRTVSPHSPRGQHILEAWRNRDKAPSPEEIILLNTGIPLERLRTLAANDDWIGYFGSASLENPSPLQIAARMTRFALFEQDQRQVLERVARMRLSALDSAFVRLRAQAEQEVAGFDGVRAYEQGYRLAQWLRRKLTITDSTLVDPKRYLEQWGVTVTNTQICDSVDAIARWDEERAGILLNQGGLRAQFPWGRRSTLAHELAHLLVDTRHALPAVEVLGRRTDAFWEKRANAFAAEFLLPASQVKLLLPDIIRPETIQPILHDISEHFEVGHILAARQIQNLLIREEDGRLDRETRTYLEQVGDRHGGPQANHWLQV
ncbi:MAG: ImmA/IrrE family metallo-endopeptidase [Magnetococcales bacterium]|nr:ImmA/IrrE family metallo-endopeptidase [Magnetococcales bacterium]